MSPLIDHRGEVAYFLGGQIDCSTTIQSCTDVLKVLSVNDDELDLQDLEGRGPPSIRREEGYIRVEKTKSSFFKSWRKYKAPSTLPTRHEVGMENELLDRVSKMNFKTQVEAFYTAYSKVFSNGLAHCRYMIEIDENSMWSYITTTSSNSS